MFVSLTSHAQTKVYQDLLLVGRLHGGFERDFVTVVVLSRVVPLMVACEQQTHFRSSLLSLRKIER